MKTLGGLMMGAGAIGAGGALLIKTTVATSVPSVLPYGTADVSEVHNLGLLQTQQLLFTAACAIFVAGAVFLACGLVLDAFRKLERIDAAVEPVPAALDAVPQNSRTPVPEPNTAALYWIGGIVIAAVAVALTAGILK